MTPKSFRCSQLALPHAFQTTIILQYSSIAVVVQVQYSRSGTAVAGRKYRVGIVPPATAQLEHSRIHRWHSSGRSRLGNSDRRPTRERCCFVRAILALRFGVVFSHRTTISARSGRCGPNRGNLWPASAKSVQDRPNSVASELPPGVVPEIACASSCPTSDCPRPFAGQEPPLWWTPQGRSEVWAAGHFGTSLEHQSRLPESLRNGASRRRYCCPWHSGPRRVSLGQDRAAMPGRIP